LINAFKITDDLYSLIEETPNIIVPIKHKQLIKEVLRLNYDFRAVAKNHNMNYHTLRKKVYRIHQEILLYQKICKGHIKTRPIPGTRLHDNINNFIIKLKLHINSNDLSLFDEFEMDINTKKRLIEAHINKIISYQIEFKERKLYQLLIAYFDNSNNFNGMWIDLKVSRNKISIAASPITPYKILKFKREDLPHPLPKTFRDGPDGLPTFPRDEMERKLEECKDKVEVIYEDKKKKKT
jgi:hypothetical protein